MGTEINGAWLEIVEMVGFPAWALVVAYFGLSLGRQLKELNRSMQEYILRTERRLTKLETLVSHEVEVLDELRIKND
jgi:hypothetical protein